MWFKRSLPKRKKLTIMIKGYTSVPLNWSGKIDGITITSALATENTSTIQHYPNLYNK